MDNICIKHTIISYWNKIFKPNIYNSKLDFNGIIFYYHKPLPVFTNKIHLNDMMLVSILAGLISGLGLGLIFKGKGSSGGIRYNCYDH